VAKAVLKQNEEKKPQEERHTAKWLKDGRATLEAVTGEINGWRTVCAHQPFESDGKGGLQFDVSLARNPPNNHGHLPSTKLEMLLTEMKRVEAEIAALTGESEYQLLVVNLGMGKPEIGKPAVGQPAFDGLLEALNERLEKLDAEDEHQSEP